MPRGGTKRKREKYTHTDKHTHTHTYTLNREEDTRLSEKINFKVQHSSNKIYRRRIEKKQGVDCLRNNTGKFPRLENKSLGC